MISRSIVRPIRVTVVEDDTGVSRMLRLSLSLAGFDVAEASVGAEALHNLERSPIDAVILDLGLQDGRGGEVLDRLRDRDDGPAWVVISALDVARGYRAIRSH